MSNELSHQEYIAIEKALTDLRTCYEARLREYENKDNLIDKAVTSTLHYAIDIINIHLQLAELKFEKWSNNMAEAYKEAYNGK